MIVKAKEFKIPYKWQERHVCIKDQVWFLPPNVPEDPFVFSGWEHPELFDSKRPVRVEYCSGNGSWIVEKARRHTEYNWLAVEKQFFRARQIWARAKSAGIKNIAVALAEGYELSQRYIPSATIEEVYVNFPDPWPKRRHCKHRIINVDFVNELARIVKPHGFITLVTDDDDYSVIMQQEVGNNAAFTATFEPIPADYGSSFFESLFRGQDKTIKYHRYVKSR